MSCKWFSNKTKAQIIAVINSVLLISALLYASILFKYPDVGKILTNRVDKLVYSLIYECHQILAITIACLYLPFNIMLHAGIVLEKGCLVSPMMCLSFSTAVSMCPVLGVIVLVTIMGNYYVFGSVAAIVCPLVLVYSMYAWNMLCRLNEDFICQKQTRNSEQYNRVRSNKPVEDFELSLRHDC